MSNSGIKKNLDFEKLRDKNQKDFKILIKQYNQLKEENQNLIAERQILKDLFIENAKKNHQNSLIEETNLNTLENSKFRNSFYFQIILGILVIVLSLGFHIVYLSVTDCLLYNDGDPGCWIKNWMGIDIHTSFYLDILLYSIIVIQSLLIILIVKNKLNN